MESESILSLLSEAGTLLVAGMVFVYSFLALLILGIKLIEAFAKKYPGPQPAAVIKRPQAKPIATKSNGVDGAVVAAISAAVHQHQQAQRK